jgi:ABC-type protease/lipase transport system fused ATPase/permease subunit
MSQLPRPLRQPPASAELAAALGACRRAFLAIALFSGMSNILMLTGSLFMLEVYDRVIPSRSVPTLVALLILASGLYAAQGVIDAIRSRILVRVGNSLDETLSLRVYDAIVRLPLTLGVRSEGAQPIRDLDTVRSFLSGTGPIALFDLPWLPVYLGICFLFHTYIGLTAVGGAIILVTLTLLTEMLTRRPTRSATQFAAARNTLMEASRRNAEAITAMGMTARIAQHWSDLNRNYVASAARASGRRRRLWCDVEGPAHDAAVRPARGRRLAGDPSGVHLRHHHRRIDPRQPRPGAGRSRHRQLARFRRRQAGLEPAFAPLHAPARRR